MFDGVPSLTHELDEEFFELEKDDVRRLLAELASARSGEPLRTEKQREAEAQRSQERWSKVCAVQA